MENQKQDLAKSKADFTEEHIKHPAKGINDWNDRLDENLEPEDHNDTIADEKAKDFSAKYGSGNQSDENNS
ncbi:hypothetical protein G7074_26430 [Pedobacter sp. HDW13]|uniref:hypothetical protein n=1 Tax=unclassified Pedobacter TaxID=2628915 RepID=UPI000F5A84E7|nr:MULTISPECIES: hypothetical protein [unclassified Pedobacter]QIL42488.1 hypothetical protein G7074_26430 [Pedobacter sp. HDW13]RQO78969.1 hypothetical protein DBR40_04385 [Pedobacter sp. KBW01]